MSGPDLPTGTVTFLFTDVAGSTALWEQAPRTMGPAMARHDELVEAAVRDHSGMVVRPRGEGDSRFAVFTQASAAVAAAVAIQRALAGEPWPTPRPIRVRIALHTGECELRDGDYYGTAVNRCARLRGIAHPGQIVVSNATAGVTVGRLPVGVTLLDLGEHRLRDLAGPEHVHQAVHADLEAAFPPLSSLDVATHNLPTQLAALVGRDTELADLRRLVSTHRLVTLTGPSGTGKTRLGIAVAADLLSQFPDGVWLAELDALTDQDLVGSAVASALGVHESAGDAVTDSIARHLGSKAALVVLDNCEHVIDSAAKVVEALLRSTPAAHVLATSQEPLGIGGENVYPLAPLRAADAVALFEQSARTANPSFRLDARAGAAARTICLQLDGIPLAVQLAAARTRVLTPEQIVERLGDRFRLLSAGDRGGPDRHRTLAAAVDWSYDLLLPAEQLLYRRLSVFAGGATLEAIEAICSDAELAVSDVVDLAQRLVERSLLIHDASGAEPRYRMLSTIHEHATGKCADAGDVRELRDRHLVWFRARAEAGYWGVRGNEAQWWTHVVRTETANMRAALQWALDSQQAELGLDTYRHLYRAWIGHGFLREGIRWGERLLALASAEPSVAKARALGCLADLRQMIGGDSVEPLTAALAMAKTVGDAATEAFVEYIWAQVATDRAGPAASLEHLRAAHRLLPPADANRPVIELNIGLRLLDLARFEDVLDHAESRLPGASRAGQQYVVAALKALSAVALAELGRLPEARQRAVAAVAEMRAIGDRYSLGIMLLLSADVLARDPATLPDAAAITAEGLEIFAATEDWSMLIEALLGAAEVATAAGRTRPAQQFGSGRRGTGAGAQHRAEPAARVAPQPASPRSCGCRGR